MSSEHVKLGDTVRFGVVTHNPSGGGIIDADETPRWYVYEDGTDTPVLEDLFTKRSGFTGTYRGFFDASGVTGFESNKYYEIQASGKVNGVVDRAILKTFVLDDVYDANIVRVSGTPVNNINDFHAPPSGIAFAVWNEEITLTAHSGADSAGLFMRYAGGRVAKVGSVNDVSPTTTSFNTTLTEVSNFWNDALLTFINGNLIGQSVPIGTYVQTNGGVAFDEAFVVAPANGDKFHIITSHIHPIGQISAAVWDETKSAHNTANTFGESLQDIYFANIKYVKDESNSADEYAVQWYKNSIFVSSGNLTNPAISVYNTNTGAALFENQSMNYISTSQGAVRHNETTNLTASGEPYLVVTSGTIGGSSRVWKMAIGLDVF